MAGYADPPKDKQFKKGKTGNPKGRPKLPDLTEVIADELGEKGYNEIIAKLHKMAKAGHTRAAEILLDRGYGKPNQKIDVGDHTIIVKFQGEE